MFEYTKVVAKFRACVGPKNKVQQEELFTLATAHQ